MHANEFNPVAKAKFRSLFAITCDQIGFAAHDDQFDRLHAGGGERLHDKGQSLALKLSQSDKQAHEILVVHTKAVTKSLAIELGWFL